MAHLNHDERHHPVDDDPICSPWRDCPTPLQAWMSRAAGDRNQGALQGVISSLNALAMMITPITMTSIFYAFSKDDSAFYFPGMPFFISGILVLIALLVFFRIPPQK